MLRIHKILFLLATILALPTSLVIATPINYGDFSDIPPGSVMYLDVEESSGTDSGPLYGPPSVAGNELLFPTTGGFTASSLDGGPSDQTDGRLSLMIAAQPGFFLDNFIISEGGLVLLDAPFDGDAFASVTAFGKVKVVEISGVPVNIPSFDIFLNASPLNGVYKLSDIGGTSYASGWQASVLVGLPQNTTKVNLVLDNNLFASTTGQGSRAFIDKKAFEIDVETRVPEPHTLLLGVGSILPFAGRRRRAIA